VVDRYLRPWKARLYAPLLRPLAAVPPNAVTVVGLGVGVAAAAAAALGRFELALAGWWVNRLLDGLDGELARAARRRTLAGSAGAPAPAADAATRGPYLDLMADLIVYAAVPLGLAAGAAGALTGAPIADPAAVWAAAAFALAAFYLNLGSWSLLAPALNALEATATGKGDGAARAAARAAAPAVERADAGASERADAGASEASAPGLRIPAGLMEGAETVVAFTVALWWPAWAATTLTAIGALTLVGALQRTLWGLRRLRLAHG